MKLKDLEQAKEVNFWALIELVSKVCHLEDEEELCLECSFGGVKVDNFLDPLDVMLLLKNNYSQFENCKFRAVRDSFSDRIKICLT